MGATPFLSLPLKGEKAKIAIIMRVEAIEMQPHLYQIITSHNGFLPESHPINTYPVSVSNLLLLAISFFFLSLFLSFPVLEKIQKNKKQDRGCFKLRTLPSYQLARHTLYF